MSRLVKNNDLKKRILIVDDNEKCFETFKLIFLDDSFISFGYASNGLDALETLDVVSYDLIISDIQMPKCGGIDLATKIRNQNHQIPIILTSGNHHYSEDTRLGLLNINTFFPKPIPDLFKFREHVLSILLACQSTKYNDDDK